MIRAQFILQHPLLKSLKCLLLVLQKRVLVNCISYYIQLIIFVNLIRCVNSAFDIIISDELFTNSPLHESNLNKTKNCSLKCEDILGKFYFQYCRTL